MADQRTPLNTQLPGKQDAPSPFIRALGIGGLCLVMFMIAGGDLAEVTPGLEGFVASPIFPFIHESHDIVALILGVYLAHRLTPHVGVIAVAWFLAVHIPYILITFPTENPEVLRLMVMGGAAFFGIRIIRVRKQVEQKLAEQVMKDPLTGLLNHLHFHYELEYQLALARRYGEKMVVMFIDLDDFKIVNDHFGHHSGDELLKQVANLLRHHLRMTDSLARLGGDEFAAILPRTNLDQAQLAAERFNKAIHSLTVNASVPISASIGFAVYPGDGDSAESLLSFADRAMYHDKEGGRS